MKDHRKAVEAFLQSDKKDLKIKYSGKHKNAMWGWDSLRNPFHSYWNAFIMELCKKMPSLALKNALYRMVGFRIGKDVGIGPNVFLEPMFPELLTVEDGAIIGGQSLIVCHEFTNNETRLARTHIKKNAMIGSPVTIRAGVTIGENAMVSSMSFVNKDVPDNELWGGVPAKFIRKINGK